MLWYKLFAVMKIVINNRLGRKPCIFVNLYRFVGFVVVFVVVNAFEFRKWYRSASSFVHHDSSSKSPSAMCWNQYVYCRLHCCLYSFCSSFFLSFFGTETLFKSLYERWTKLAYNGYYIGSLHLSGSYLLWNRRKMRRKWLIDFR